MPRLISIVTPCYNEAASIVELYNRTRAVFDFNSNYVFEHIFIDNASTDNTVEILKTLSSQDNRIKIIVNSRNFGHIRSPYYGYLQASGSAVISIVSDLQDPPELITNFIKEWEKGALVVVGIKTKSEENPIIYLIRSLYYKTIKSLSDTQILEHYTGFGLYDKSIIDILRNIQEPYPFFRGLVTEITNNIKCVEFVQPARVHGKSTINLLKLFDNAMLGVTSYSKVPLRIATLVGFVTSIMSLFLVFIYTGAKLLFWDKFGGGIAPIVIGMFFLGSVNLLFLGIIAEYIGAILTRVQNRPLVIEKERINF